LRYRLEEMTNQGYVFNIQRYSIHDGPGIRTAVFFKGCPLRCFWCQNPESQTPKPELFYYKDRCIGCGRCVQVCPNKAVRMMGKTTRTDRILCVGCGQCVENCPNEARKTVGILMTADEVLGEVLKDRKFYENSGGGLTLSGGEPLYQIDFALEILERCKESGLHNVIETTGAVPWEHFEKILSCVDLVLYDIKQINSEIHKTGTGISNILILSNLQKLAKLKNIKVRMPLIPGLNNSSGDILEVARFIKKEIGPVEIELLAYNKMGESKYDRLDRPGPALET
jgi:pyruvate formate lyase activating enzyme